MSARAVKWASQVPNLKMAERSVLSAICGFADVDGTCFPKVETIAEKADCSRSTAKRCIGSLIERGLLSCTPRRRPNGSQSSSLFALNLDLGRGSDWTSVQRFKMNPLLKVLTSKTSRPPKARKASQREAELNTVDNVIVLASVRAK